MWKEYFIHVATIFCMCDKNISKGKVLWLMNLCSQAHRHAHRLITHAYTLI